MKSTGISLRVLTAALVVAGLAAHRITTAGEPPAPSNDPYPKAAPIASPPAPGLPLADAACEDGCCTGIPILSKLPYISRLFRNVGVGKPHGVRFTVRAETMAAPAQGAAAPISDEANYNIDVKETTADTGTIGVEAQLVEHQRRVWQPVQPETSAPCAEDCGDQWERIGVDFNVVRDLGFIKVIRVKAPWEAAPCTQAACTEAGTSPVTTAQCPPGKCACGTSCSCGTVTIDGHPLNWFAIRAPGVKLPTLIDKACLAADPATACTVGVCTSGVCTSGTCNVGGAPCTGEGWTNTEARCTPHASTHHATVAAAPAAHHAGCPFQALHEQLVAALTENAYLKGKHETRESLTEAFVTASVENAKLQTQIEVYGELFEIKEQHAEEKQELIEQIVEMQEEFLGQLTEVQVENARLELQAEVAEERRALLVQFAEAQVEFTRKTAELQTKAAQIEQQLHAIEQVKAENAALKARVAELLGKQPESQPAAHTATRPVPSVAK